MRRALLGALMFSAVLAVLIWRDDAPLPGCDVGLTWTAAQQ